MVSVLVASYNGEKYIISQLESILKQTVPADEVIICDDVSSDNTAELISRFIEENQLDNWHFSVNPKNKGYCMNFFDMLSSAEGDIIFLADQDDVWHPEKIEKMAAVLDNHPEINALFSSADAIDGKGLAIPPPKNAGVFYSGNSGRIEAVEAERFVGKSFIRGCSLCFRISLLNYIGKLELGGLLSHDWMITFVAALTGSCAHLDVPLISYRCHGENTSFGECSAGRAGREKRINGILNSVAGHSYIYENSQSFENMSENLKLRLSKHIEFEKNRAEFLKSGSLRLLLPLVKAFKCYKCYYGSLKGALRVLVGDILYVIRQ